MQIRDLIEAIPDSSAISLSAKATIGGSGAGIFASIADWNWTAICASLVAVIGLAANLYFQRRRDRRERELHKAQMAALRARCEL